MHKQSESYAESLKLRSKYFVFSSQLKVEARDKEIERLNRLLDGGRPVDAVLREGKKDSSERVIAHLNVQVNARYP